MSVRLVLASGSPRRAAVLCQLGLDPVIRPADVDEAFLADETLDVLHRRLARSKAQAVALLERDDLVVAGDTVVLDGDRVLGKPSGVEETVSMLTALAGGTHEVLSGLALAGSHGMVSAVARTTVHFRDFDEATARRYASTGEPLDKAGAYGIQGLGAALVAGVDGDYYSVMGFPVAVFLDLLDQVGWRYDFGSLTKLSG